MLAFAAEKDIRLNIELKPTGHEENFEQIVVDAILAQDMQYQCVVTSQVYSVLRNIKEYNEDIYTVYVMKMAAGDITRLQYADAFSVNATFVTNQLVTHVHNHGQEIYAWTVNTRRNLDKVIRLNVDHIVTDRVELAKTAILESKASNFILEYVSFVMEFFAA